ncbi:biotin transport system substrate-specific component [Psychrobacillus psychrotolerans]|uniref:Biotin transporter n=1 Tax=Psychrobacillus psychrotolerans TaxID=126156 RepID=A0A1I5Y6W8_9BACI|nr:biotin transporter BioY [Psychrobacillus psychrotolerans]SFQ39914.1 biotin transport system substrate-specific component [Psychrobacillus psychrotolerans]
MRNERLKMMIVAALFAAIIAVAAQIMINVPPVPFTLMTIAVMLTATILGAKYGTLAVTVYVLMGVIGIPVFAGMKGGFGIVLGPTGGYLLAIIPAALFVGWYLDTFKYSRMQAIIANIIAVFIILILGSIWLKIVAELPWDAAFKGGMLPFILPDLAKAVVAALIGIIIRTRLVAAKLI